MSVKRYWWKKTPENYFANPKIKKIRKIPGGDTYTIIYQKIQLLSIRGKGTIIYEGLEDTLAKELALKIDESYEAVEITMSLMQKMALIEDLGNDKYLIPEVVPLIGSESDSAERVRKHRTKKALHCNKGVTPMLRSGNKSVTTDKEIEISYRDILSLTDTEIENIPFKKFCILTSKFFNGNFLHIKPDLLFGFEKIQIMQDATIVDIDKSMQQKIWHKLFAGRQNLVKYLKSEHPP